MDAQNQQENKQPNKFIYFLSGLFWGSLLTILIMNIPQEFSLFSDEETPEKDVVESVEHYIPEMKLPQNSRVERHINAYVNRGKLDLFDAYKRSGRYLPMIETIFDEYNLPSELSFLPIIESRFIPSSRSHVGAVGLWQIMPTTASEYGLEFNRWIDERRDPEKSTIVAAEYLQFLYDRFKNWDLTLAAYNCGYSKLLRVMRRENTDDFWKLRGVPRETYQFVPKFYAISHIIRNPEKYGIELPEITESLEFETIDLEATFSVEQLAELANVSPAVIKKYNPAIIGNLAPSGKYSVRVPVGVKELFLERFSENPLDRVELTYTTYRVKRGDTLSKIAKNFNTTINAIMRDNNLRSSRWIKAGMRLRIATMTVIKQSATSEIAEDTDDVQIKNVKFIYRVERPGLSVKTLARYYSTTSEELKKWNPWIKAEKLDEGEELIIYKSQDDIELYKTRRGDSLWLLARKFKTTVSNLIRWNQLENSRIYPGTSLIVSLK